MPYHVTSFQRYSGYTTDFLMDKIFCQGDFTFGAIPESKCFYRSSVFFVGFPLLSYNTVQENDRRKPP